MRKSICQQWFDTYLKEVSEGRGHWPHSNPAREFVRKAKAGQFHELSDESYRQLLRETEELSDHRPAPGGRRNRLEGDARGGPFPPPHLTGPEESATIERTL